MAYLYNIKDETPIECCYNPYNKWISLLDGNHRLALAKLFDRPTILVYWF